MSEDIDNALQKILLRVSNARKLIRIGAYLLKWNDLTKSSSQSGKCSHDGSVGQIKRFLGEVCTEEY